LVVTCALETSPGRPDHKLEKERPVPDITVGVAAYSSYTRAAQAWNRLDLDPGAATSLIDAMVIEWADEQVSLVRCSLVRHGWGFGAIASAIVGALWPPALLTGALAGGVGDQVLTCVSGSIPSHVSTELSRVLRLGRIAIVAVMATPEGTHTAKALETHALELALSTLACSSRELLTALRADADTNGDL
jgi:hypothetical protein